MTKNFSAYLKFDESKYKGKYLIFVKGKLFKAGANLLKMLEEARKKYPKEIPLISKPLTGENYILNVFF